MQILGAALRRDSEARCTCRRGVKPRLHPNFSKPGTSFEVLDPRGTNRICILVFSANLRDLANSRDRRVRFGIRPEEVAGMPRLLSSFLMTGDFGRRWYSHRVD